jgi:DNA topoisomerase VI subunit A
MCSNVYHIRDDDPPRENSVSSIDNLEALILRICLSILTSEDTSSLHVLTRACSGKAKSSPLSSPFKLRQLSQTVHLLNMIHRLCIEGRQVNQRELFYRSLGDASAPSFSDQPAMNRALACVLSAVGCARHELGIFTTARGLIAADHREETLCLDSNAEFLVDVSDHPEGLSISESLVDVCTLQTTAKFVLIVEKETVFQSLVTCEDFFLKNSCILVTGRGYPDNITIRLLSKLKRIFPVSFPFLYLGDLDPHGLSICLTYRKSLGDDLQWIGVNHQDLSNLDHYRVMGIRMKSCDVSLVNSLIENSSTPDEFKSELALLETRGEKYEVECLHSVGENYLATEWLPNKVASVIY